MGSCSNSNDEEELNRGAWTASEDKLLTTYIQIHGEGKWRTIPERAGLKRCGKSCRFRWLNYLRPGIKRGNITHDEEELIRRLHKLLGNRWSLIAGRLPGRTDNEIKNYWNKTLSKNAKEELYPSKKSEAREKPKQSNSEPKLIQTKASRCNKVVIPTTISSSFTHQQSTADNLFNFSNSSLELQGHLNQFTNQSHGLQSTIMKAEQLVDYDPDSLNYLNSGRNCVDEPEMNADHFCRDFKFDSNNVPVDAVHLVPIDQRLMMNGWTTTTAGFGDNGYTDKDFLALLLGSQEWPSQI